MFSNCIRMTRLLAALLPLFALHASWVSLPAGTAQAWMIGADATGQRLWLGVARGGLWQTLDAGTTWLPSNNLISPGDRLLPLEISALDVNGDTLILKCANYNYHSQIWYSFDGGSSWTHFRDELLWNWPGDFFAFWRLNHQTWLHCDGQVFQRSFDNGLTWSTFVFPDTTIGPVRGIVQDPVGDSTLLLPKGYQYGGSPPRGFGGLCRSTNLGETWTPVFDFHQLFGLTSATVEDVARLTDGRLLFLISLTDPEWENGTILASTDDGATWTRIFGGLPDRFQPAKVLEDPSQPGTLFLRGNQKYGLYWSHDYGSTWSRCLNGLPTNVCIVNDVYLNQFSGEIYAACTGFGVYVSGNHGQMWQPVPMPPIGPLGEFGIASESIFERDDGYRSWRLEPGVGEWTELSPPFAQDTLVMMRPMCYQHADTLVTALAKRNVTGPAADRFQMTYSYDAGQTWQNDPFLQWPTLPFYFNVMRSEHVIRFLDLEPSILRWTEDLGHTWYDAPLAPGFWPTGYVVQNDSAFYVTAVDSNLYTPEIIRSVDHGQTWQTLGFPGPMFENPVPVLLEDVLIIVAHDRLWRWRQGTWEQRGTVPSYQDLSYLISIPQPNRTLLFGVSGATNQAWFSSDTGLTWQTPAIEAPFADQGYGFTGLKWDDARQEIWAIHALGTCYLPVSALNATGPLNLLPADFTVLSCYPSPFNITTRIRFDLAREMSVKVDVFDLLGRHVCNLVDGRETAGRHEVTFDATSLSSGTYFVQLESNTRHRVQKILLLK